jgi:hypothetical protein
MNSAVCVKRQLSRVTRSKPQQKHWMKKGSNLMLINEVVRLNKRCHNVLSFDCGNPSLNPFLRRYAVKNMALNFSNTFVLAYVLADQPPAKKQNIAGYYRLAISV